MQKQRPIIVEFLTEEERLEPKDEHVAPITPSPKPEMTPRHNQPKLQLDPIISMLEGMAGMKMPKGAIVCQGKDGISIMKGSADPMRVIQFHLALKGNGLEGESISPEKGREKCTGNFKKIGEDDER